MPQFVVRLLNVRLLGDQRGSASIEALYSGLFILAFVILFKQIGLALNEKISVTVDARTVAWSSAMTGSEKPGGWLDDVVRALDFTTVDNTLADVQAHVLNDPFSQWKRMECHTLDSRDCTIDPAGKGTFDRADLFRDVGQVPGPQMVTTTVERYIWPITSPGRNPTLLDYTLGDVPLYVTLRESYAVEYQQYWTMSEDPRLAAGYDPPIWNQYADPWGVCDGGCTTLMFPNAFPSHGAMGY